MPVTYEEIVKARGEYNNAYRAFSAKYHDFLLGVLKEAGVLNKTVKIRDVNDKHLIGQFRVFNDSYAPRPWEIKFFPITKGGSVSLKSKLLRNFYPWREENLVDQLRDILVEVLE